MDITTERELAQKVRKDLRERAEIEGFGIIDLADLLTDFRWQYAPNGHGAYLFCNVKRRGWSTEGGRAFCAKPSPMVARLFGEHLSSFEIIPWPDTGVALVLGRIRSHFGTRWLGIVPVDQVPDPKDYR